MPLLSPSLDCPHARRSLLAKEIDLCSNREALIFFTMPDEEILDMPEDLSNESEDELSDDATDDLEDDEMSEEELF